MHRFLIIIWVVWPLMGWSQIKSLPFGQPPTTSYVILNPTQLDIHHIITERAGENYIGITSARVEIYNILRPLPKQLGKPHADTLLISLSILPLSNGLINWKHIQLDSLPKSSFLSIDDLIKQANEKVADYFQKGKPLNRTQLSSESVIPIIQNGNHYYITNTHVLTSLFIIRPHTVHSISQTDMATIDSSSPLFPVDSLLSLVSRQNGNTHAQLWAAVQTGNIVQSRNNGYYEFWSNPKPLSHANLLYYGMDKFLYKPGIGIVSGKYESFFSERNQFIDDFFDVVSIDGRRVKAKH